MTKNLAFSVAVAAGNILWPVADIKRVGQDPSAVAQDDSVGLSDEHESFLNEHESLLDEKFRYYFRNS